MHLEWQKAILLEKNPLTVSTSSFIFQLPHKQDFRSGQYYDIRLSSHFENDTFRSYSIASCPENKINLEFGIKYIPHGEISSALFSLERGAIVEMRGPLGKEYTWNPTLKNSLILIGGGSGIVPLISMLRHNYATSTFSSKKILFLASVKSFEEFVYRDELIHFEKIDKQFHLQIAYTLKPPVDWHEKVGRFTAKSIKSFALPLKNDLPLIYISGPTGFVEHMEKCLETNGFLANQIKTERFG